MTVFKLIVIIMLAIPLILCLIPMIKALIDIVNINSIFTCSECKEVNATLKHNCKCSSCGKEFKPHNKRIHDWEKYLHASVSEINTSLEDFEYSNKFYIKDKVVKVFLYIIPVALLGALLALILVNITK